MADAKEFQAASDQFQAADEAYKAQSDVVSRADLRRESVIDEMTSREAERKALQQEYDQKLATLDAQISDRRRELADILNELASAKDALDQAVAKRAAARQDVLTLVGV